MSLFKTIPLSVPGDIEIQPLLAVIRAELERQRCSVTVSKRGDLAVFAKRIPIVAPAQSNVVNLFKHQPKPNPHSPIPPQIA